MGLDTGDRPSNELSESVILQWDKETSVQEEMLHRPFANSKE